MHSGGFCAMLGREVCHLCYGAPLAPAALYWVLILRSCILPEEYTVRLAQVFNRSQT